MRHSARGASPLLLEKVKLPRQPGCVGMGAAPACGERRGRPARPLTGEPVRPAPRPAQGPRQSGATCYIFERVALWGMWGVLPPLLGAVRLSPHLP